MLTKFVNEYNTWAVRTQKGSLPPEQDPSGGGSSTSPLCLPLVLKPGGPVLAAVPSTVSPSRGVLGAALQRESCGVGLALAGLPAPLHVWRQVRGIVLLQLNVRLGLATHGSKICTKIH